MQLKQTVKYRVMGWIYTLTNDVRKNPSGDWKAKITKYTT
jgi:hypothetical protein